MTVIALGMPSSGGSGEETFFKMREEVRETLFPLPLSFGEKMEILVPFGIDEIEFPKSLQGLIATLWEGLDVENFPLEGVNPYNPLGLFA